MEKKAKIKVNSKKLTPAQLKKLIGTRPIRIDGGNSKK